MSQARPTDPEANAYAESYVLYGEQSKAWRIAFPSSKAKPKAVHEKASTFHRIDKVRQRVKEIRETLKIQAEEKFQISSEQLQKTLAMVMKKGLTEKIDAQGNKVAHALPAVVSAVGEINKMNGNHAATRLAVGGDPDGIPIETENTPLTKDQALELLKKNGMS